MSFSDIANHLVSVPVEREFTVLRSLDDIDDYYYPTLTPRHTSYKQIKRKQLTNPLLQDIFGDFICGIVSCMHDYWSQSGFMNKVDRQVAASDVLDILKHLTVVEEIEIEEDHEDDDPDNIFMYTNCIVADQDEI